MRRRIIFIAVLMIVAWFVLSWFFMWPPICWMERTTYKTACLNNLRCIDAAAEQRALANRKTKTWNGPCLSNLRSIKAAKEQWALANHKTNGDDVVVSAVNEYLENRTTPVCSDGGRYIYSRIGEYPTCTLDGQMVPARPAKIRTSLFTWRWVSGDRKPHRHCSNLKGFIAEQSAAPEPPAPAGPSDGAR